MSVARNSVEAALRVHIPQEILTNLLNEYQHIKSQFFLRKFQPSELNGARFAESMLRLVQHEDKGTYTAFGASLDSDRIIRSAENNVGLTETLRFFIPRLSRVILDVRNRRDVAHVGGDVSPNYSDSLFVVQSCDWLLTELVRHFYNCSIDEAKHIVHSINEINVPIVAEVDGFVRVQDTALKTRDKCLVILYHKAPQKISDSNLLTWTGYSNITQFKNQILKKLDSEALIHYKAGACSLLPKGIRYVEKNISLELLD